MFELEIIGKIKNKIELNYDEIKYIVNGYTEGKITDEKMTMFLKNICDYGLTNKEAFSLTEIMLQSGSTIDLSDVSKKTIDKHSTGGIGDKISLIVGPIVACSGVAVAKLSGRGLGYTGGTIDKLESIPGYNVNLNHSEFINTLNTIGCSIISPKADIAPADKKIYALRDITNTVESTELIASSIMSKKLASGSDNIVIDLKVGKGAFMKDLNSAVELSKLMKKIANNKNKNLISVLTNMDYPIGRNVGNALEVLEVIDYFNNLKDERLDTLVREISAHMICLSKNIPYEEAVKEITKIINSDLAKDKFYEWIKAQGGKLEELKLNAKKYVITSPKSGYINNVDALLIGEIVCDLGAGRKSKEDKIDYSAGIILNKTIGEHVKKDEPLITYYTNKDKAIGNNLINAFTLEDNYKPAQNIILKIIK